MAELKTKAELSALLDTVLVMRKDANHIATMIQLFSTLRDSKEMIGMFHDLLKERMALTEPKRIHNRKVMQILERTQDIKRRLLFVIGYIDILDFVENEDDSIRSDLLERNKYGEHDDIVDEYAQGIPHNLSRMKAHARMLGSKEMENLVPKIMRATKLAIGGKRTKILELLTNYEGIVKSLLQGENYLELLNLHKDMVNFLIFDNAVRNVTIAADSIRKNDELRKNLVFRISFTSTSNPDERPYLVIQDDVIFYQPRDKSKLPNATTLLSYKASPESNLYSAVNYILTMATTDNKIETAQKEVIDRSKFEYPYVLSLESKGEVLFKFTAHVEDYKRVKAMNVLNRILQKEQFVFYERMVGKLFPGSKTHTPKKTPQPLIESPYKTPFVYSNDFYTRSPPLFTPQASPVQRTFKLKAPVLKIAKAKKSTSPVQYVKYKGKTRRILKSQSNEKYIQVDGDRLVKL